MPTFTGIMAAQMRAVLLRLLFERPTSLTTKIAMKLEATFDPFGGCTRTNGGGPSENFRG